MFYSFIHFCWHLFETDRFVKVFRLVETDRLKCFYSFIHFCWDLFETDRLVKVFRWDPLSAHGWGAMPYPRIREGYFTGKRGKLRQEKLCNPLLNHSWMIVHQGYFSSKVWMAVLCDRIFHRNVIFCDQFDCELVGRHQKWTVLSTIYFVCPSSIHSLKLCTNTRERAFLVSFLLLFS